MDLIYQISVKLALVLATINIHMNTSIAEAKIQAEHKKAQPVRIVSQPTPKPEAPQIASDLNAAANQYRIDHGLNTLAIRQDLCDVAHTRAEEIKSNFSHQGFRDKIDQGSLAYLSYGKIAENIWQGSQNSIVQTMQSWDQSPSHKDALLDNWTWGCGAHTGHHAVFMFMR